MHRTRVTGYLVTAVFLLCGGAVRAASNDEPAAVARATPPEIAGAGFARETKDGLPLLNERTAYLVGAKRLKLGILEFEYGLTDRVSVGTDPPAWAARAFVSVLLPNLHVKAGVFHRGPVTLTVKAAGYYGILKDNGSAAGSLIAVPLSLFASFRIHERIWLHEEFTYLYAHAFGTGDLNEAGIKGQVVGQALQDGLMFEWRLTRIFSVTAAGRVGLWTGALAFSGNGTTDPYTTINIDGTAQARVEHPWNVVGGIAVLWKHFHLIAGAGYGYYFLPGIDIVYPHLGVVPEISLSVLL